MSNLFKLEKRGREGVDEISLRRCDDEIKTVSKRYVFRQLFVSSVNF